MQGRKIFLVGMSPFFYGQYHKKFTQEGSEVFILDNEECCLVEAEKNYPDVVIIDSSGIRRDLNYIADELIVRQGSEGQVEIVFLIEQVEQEHFEDKGHRFFSKLNLTPSEIIERIKLFLK
ncbi:hypothetical protein ACFL08_03250 [Patescibacteria group bacterium]